MTAVVALLALVAAGAPARCAVRRRQALVRLPGRPHRAAAAVSRWCGPAAALVGALDRRRLVVAVALGAAVVVALGPVPLLAVVGGVALVHRQRALRAARARRRAVADELPDLTDLLRLAAEAGLTVPLAVRQVAEVADGPVAAALAGALHRTERGARLADALEEARGLDPAAAPLVDALVASERYGAPLLPALERLGVDARDQRRRRAEADARRVPVRLLFPLVACVLPSVGLLTVVPVAVAALEELSP